jgi:hypothetical protein
MVSEKLLTANPQEDPKRKMILKRIKELRLIK